MPQGFPRLVSLESFGSTSGHAMGNVFFILVWIPDNYSMILYFWSSRHVLCLSHTHVLKTIRQWESLVPPTVSESEFHCFYRIFLRKGEKYINTIWTNIVKGEKKTANDWKVIESTVTWSMYVFLKVIKRWVIPTLTLAYTQIKTGMWTAIYSKFKKSSFDKLNKETHISIQSYSSIRNYQ